MVSSALKNKILKKKGIVSKNLKKKQVSKSSSIEGGKSYQLKANQLNWKPVEIPDTLDDFEGFYGLEEIDNVTVKIVDGTVKFITKDESNKISKEDAEKKEKSIPKGNFEVDPKDINEEDIENAKERIEDEEEQEEKEEENKEETENEEKTSAEQTTETNKQKKGVKITTLIESKDVNDEIDVPELPNHHQITKKEVTPISTKAKISDELKENTFAKLNDIDIPADDVELPEWSNMSLNSSTLNGLQSLGFTKPTEIQKVTIPVSLTGKDVIGKAATGSGKTLAYGIPILEKALQTSTIKLPEDYANHPTSIIFTPTRELANQVMKHLRELFKYSPFSDKTVMSLTGGLSIQKQERLLSYGPRVLVATPGRCLELLEKSTNLAKQISSIDILVLDEADRMLQDGHFDELKKILEIFNNYRPKGVNGIDRRWQSLIFSATFSKDLFGKLDNNKSKPSNKRKASDNDEENEIKEVLEILGKKLRFRAKPEYIDVNPTEVVANKIVESMIPCSPMERDLMLYYFISVFPGTTLVFTNSIDSVKRLAPTLNNLGIPTVSIHSSMIQKQRLRALERFSKNSEIAKKENKSSILIASDVAARGLDIPGIQHVIHYHLPRTADAYVHRSGRTARAGTEGVSVVLCSPQEASGPLRNLRKAISKKDKIEDIKSLPIDSDILDQLKQRLDLAAKIAQAEVASQSVNKEQSWIEKAAEELGVDDIDEFEDDFLKRDRKRREGKQLDKQNMKVMKAQLRDLLKKQVRKSGRRSYIAGGLNNVAQMLLKNQGTNTVMGYLQQDALDVLKDKKKAKKQKI
ncbi:ATP-dependent RNA helicase [Pichia californica]|nr:ATP-dependent RNA helicase [[Candida] californica]